MTDDDWNNGLVEDDLYDDEDYTGHLDDDEEDLGPFDDDTSSTKE